MAAKDGGGVDIHPQHDGNLRQQHIADHAAAHCGNRPQEDRN